MMSQAQQLFTGSASKPWIHCLSTLLGLFFCRCLAFEIAGVPLSDIAGFIGCVKTMYF
jgi:hypothetical protein